MNGCLKYVDSTERWLKIDFSGHLRIDRAKHGIFNQILTETKEKIESASIVNPTT
jgi:hypothetical protein